MEVDLIYDNYEWHSWFWRLRTENVAHGPFNDQKEAKANATEHYKGATLKFVEVKHESRKGGSHTA
jgi:hypothetical protein